MAGLSAPGARPAARARHALRLRVFLAVAFASLVPLLLVFLWSQVERPVAGRLWKRALDAAEGAKGALAAAPGPPAAELAAIARARQVRLRVFDPAGALAFDADEDQPTDPLHPVEAFFFGASADDARRVDEELGPPAARAATLAARSAGGFADCQYLSSLVCESVLPARDARGRPYLVHAQASSARAVRAVYALRHMLLRVMLLAVPLSVALGLYAARRVSTPIVLLYQHSSARFGPPVAQASAWAAFAAGVLVFLRVLGRLVPPGAPRRVLAAPVILQLVLQVAALSQLASATSPVFARRTALGRGVDGWVAAPAGGDRGR